MSKISRTTRFRVLMASNFTCAYCGRRAPDVVLEVDHVEPRALGGSNRRDNLVAACFDCNRGKRDHPIVGVLPARPETKGRLADRLWPDGMDMVAPAYGSGRWATVSWCAGLTVHLHGNQADAENALQAINRTACGHGCWRDHELVDTDESYQADADREDWRAELRIAHFEGCRVCLFIYDGQAPEAARERHRIRAGRG